MKKKDERPNAHVRLPAELHRALARAAEKNRRPLTSEIVVRLEESFK